MYRTASWPQNVYQVLHIYNSHNAFYRFACARSGFCIVLASNLPPSVGLHSSRFLSAELTITCPNTRIHAARPSRKPAPIQDIPTRTQACSIVEIPKKATATLLRGLVKISQTTCGGSISGFLDRIRRFVENFRFSQGAPSMVSIGVSLRNTHI